MNDIPNVILGAIAGGLVGGGTIAGLAWWALLGRLKEVFVERSDVFDGNDDPRFAKIADIRPFVTRDEMNGMGQRFGDRLDRKRRDIDGVTSLLASMDERVGRVEGQAARLEERTSQQWERVGEQMSATAQTLRETVRELRDVTKTVQELAGEVRALQGKIN